jgi:hypothetical protein
LAKKLGILSSKGDNQHLQMDRSPKTTKDKKGPGLSQGLDHGDQQKVDRLGE